MFSRHGLSPFFLGNSFSYIFARPHSRITLDISLFKYSYTKINLRKHTTKCTAINSLDLQATVQLSYFFKGKGVFAVIWRKFGASGKSFSYGYDRKNTFLVRLTATIFWGNNFFCGSF